MPYYQVQWQYQEYGGWYDCDPTLNQWLEELDDDDENAIAEDVKNPFVRWRYDKSRNEQHRVECWSGKREPISTKKIRRILVSERDL